MNFYEKPLQELNDKEWEQICMKCGKCCMVKYYDKGITYFSNQMCRFFDIKKGLCSCYKSRFKMAKNDCKKVSIELLEKELYLLPPSCAYRSLYEGRGLPEYHPLLSGCQNSVEKAGKTVKNLPVFSENAQNDAVMDLLNTAHRLHWSEVKLMQKIAEIKDKYKLQLLEAYPDSTIKSSL